MMKAIYQQSCRAKASFVFRCGAALLLGSALIAAQSRIIRPESQNNSNNAIKGQHVTTLRSSDSPEGSRVTISSDLSLSDYEAYRRGDRFYIRIPSSDVPRAETLRGRGFSDVKVQRSAANTVISFRLEPGATARVEQRANRLEVVISVPRAILRTPEVVRSNPGSHVVKPPSVLPTKPLNNSSSTARNAATRANNAASNKSPVSSAKSAATPQPEKAKSKPAAEPGTPKPVVATAATPTAVPSATPKATPTPKTAAVATKSPGNQPSATPVASSQNTSASWQTRLKERIRYWTLLAQLNPIPVAIGAGVLLLLLLLFFFSRRRARGTRSLKEGRSKSTAKSVTDAASVQPASELESASVAPVAVSTAAVLATAAARERAEAAAPAIVPDGARQARVAHVAEHVKRVMAGEAYDPNVIGSDDRETRQLVGAELLSALVGRNLERRDRARDAFMKHGYFDDATRDLRIADAPVERAAAARRLSFVHDREATPHLIAALDDSAPEVRRTAVEALMDIRDPAAIAPLNSLMQVESDSKVPRTLIKHAIDACASATPQSSDLPAATPPVPSLPTEPEREVIEL